MRWLTRRLAQRNYTDMQERFAYRAGYTAGFNGHKRDRSHAYVNAYSAGYWDGVGDMGGESTPPPELPTGQYVTLKRERPS